MPERTDSEDYVNSVITPHECRIRDLTYSAPIMVKVRWLLNGELHYGKTKLGNLPIMLKSNRWVYSSPFSSDCREC